jgi:hypothetical protein
VGLVGFCTYLWPFSDQASPGGTEPEKRLAWRHKDMLKWLNQAFRLFRLPEYAGGCRHSPLLGDLFLLRSVVALEPDFDLLPGQVHLAGSCLWEEEAADDELDGWLSRAVASGRPIVYVQHGRFFHLPGFWPALVEALGSDCFVAASTLRMDTEAGAIPENFFVRPHVPQSKVLRWARVLVSAANTTAALGALTEGVPCLLVPGGGEQPEVASLLQRAGLARILSPEKATSDDIRESIETLLTDVRFRERASYYQSEFEKLKGFEQAANLLERLAATQSPVLRGSGESTMPGLESEAYSFMTPALATEFLGADPK